SGTVYIVGYQVIGDSKRYFIDRFDMDTQQLVHLSDQQLPESFYDNTDIPVLSQRKYWEITSLIETSGGDLVFLLEYAMGQQGRSIRMKNKYLICVDGDGLPRWIHTVNREVQVLPGLEGHLLMSKGDKVFILYNDHKANIKKSPEEEFVSKYSGKSGMAVVQEIDGNGKAVKYPLSSDKALDKYVLNFRLATQLGTDYFYVPAIQIFGLNDVKSKNVTFRLK
ncbi:MAG: hypothetical protein WBA74_14845, partial [Cyclobacteriaceae bacterium]